MGWWLAGRLGGRAGGSLLFSICNSRYDIDFDALPAEQKEFDAVIGWTYNLNERFKSSSSNTCTHEQINLLAQTRSRMPKRLAPAPAQGDSSDDGSDQEEPLPKGKAKARAKGLPKAKGKAKAKAVCDAALAFVFIFWIVMT